MVNRCIIADMNVWHIVKKALGQAVQDVSPLSGGCIGQVYHVTLADGTDWVAKIDESASPKLHIEGDMLDYLHSHSGLPVPKVRHSEPSLLIMAFMTGTSNLTAVTQQHAAKLLADLHNISQPQFGFAQDTLIGGLRQPNNLTDSWIEFFAEYRLRYMAQQAFEAGLLTQRTKQRVFKLADQVDKWLQEPERPSLLHGDVWTTNILAHGGRVTAFLDPALYYGHPEIELAFSTLFATFSTPFFETYHTVRPIADGFFEERRDLYNLYPLLTHVRLFGGSYLASVTRTLEKYGF